MAAPVKAALALLVLTVASKLFFQILLEQDGSIQGTSALHAELGLFMIKWCTLFGLHACQFNSFRKGKSIL